jgi:hypothetical protein
LDSGESSQNDFGFSVLGKKLATESKEVVLVQEKR